MLNIKIPKTRYNLTDYPNLSPNDDGALIPIAIGEIDNVAAVLIDSSLSKYKVAGHAIHDITAVRTERETLAAGEITEDLANGQFTVAVAMTPYLAAGTYWLVIEGDYAISSSNYIRFSRWNKTAAEHSSYSIDGSSTWTEDSSHYLEHKIRGRDALDMKDTVRINPGRETTWSQLALRDNAARTRIAQKFVVSSAFYMTSVILEFQRVGSPSGNIIISILSDDSPETQVGADSSAYAIGSDRWDSCQVVWPIRSVDLSALYADIDGAEKSGAAITDGADALEYLVETVLGKAAGTLDATYLADLKADRTYAVQIYLDSETTFGAVLGKLETTLLFKLVPLLDGTYATVVYESGEPSNTPHFHDEDYLSFSLRSDWTDVKQNTNVKYGESFSGEHTFKVESVSSDFARFFYETEETLEVETYHKTQAGSAWLAGELSGMYEAPPLIAEFEVSGRGIDLIPGRDKVKLTRTRAGYTGGTLDAVLFRIIKLVKKPGTSTVVITAQKDDQTY